MRFQGIVTPDGMIPSFYGPYPGATNDRGVLNANGLNQRLCNDFGVSPVNPLAPRYFVYADAGYTGGPNAAVYTSADLLPGFANQANSVRVSIENVFGAAKGTSLLSAWKPTLLSC